jgi:hypothetical protein
MRPSTSLLLATLVAAGGLLVPPRAPAAPAAKPAAPGVGVSIETTLKTSGDQIRQFAFDGDENTGFASEQKPGPTDHFTLVFDDAVAVRSIRITTGRPGGTEKLMAGALEISSDGKAFEPVEKFKEGSIQTAPAGRKLRAIRVRPAADLDHALAIREFTIDSTPPVAIFRYPVEFIVNVDDAPEMKEWADKAARVCAQHYPMINEQLKSDGYKPPHLVTMTLKKDYRGVAAAAGTRITGSVAFFKKRPDDIGAMVHETVHVVQRYRTRNNPGWLVEGVADYVRFYKYEPGKLKPLPPERAKYNGSYQVTARFLAFLVERYDPHIVRKLNQAMREGEYREEIWQTLTKKTLPELGDEWKESLRTPAQHSNDR